MQPQDLETLAMDRKTWRTACVNGTTRIEQENSRKRTEKRIQRHQRNLGAVPVGQYPCHRCDKIYNGMKQRYMEEQQKTEYKLTHYSQ
ncbi:hypothetical protein Pcinc_006981 [Petrolisthes cinctipes]|uniref:Uncharacterized protein n=1 Tax=Petrolisthes cinctipes TaxID=88211 RepID=A0AAE1KXF5_PETCI|nr:hypothetical protein Pcinc_006981 [Petrolisthes cinctipes]